MLTVVFALTHFLAPVVPSFRGVTKLSLIIIMMVMFVKIQSSGARQLHCFRAAGAPSCGGNQTPHTLPASYTMSDHDCHDHHPLNPNDDHRVC